MSSFFAGITRSVYNTSIGSKLASRMFVSFGSGGEICRKADDSIKRFSRLIDEKKLDRKKIKYDVVADALRFGVGTDEYFLFGFYHRSAEEKSKFLGAYQGINIWKACADQYENNENSIFRNKYLFAEKFSEFFKRRACIVKSEEDKETFLSLLHSCNKLMIKPLDESEGRNIKKLVAGEEDDDTLFRYALDRKPCIAEEFIIQGKPIADIHPASVNTVRFVTILSGDKLHHIYAILRMGCNGSCIDNLAAGGLCAAIDLKTGTLMTDAFKEDCTSFQKHPSTGVVLKGFQLPEWKQCLELVNKAARVVPSQRLVGWDLAYSEQYGWMLVEANHRPSFTGFQFCTGTGIRARVEKAAYQKD